MLGNKYGKPLPFYWYLHRNLVQALESRLKENSAPTIRSLIVDEEIMMPGNWLELVLCVCSNALTLLVKLQARTTSSP